MPLDESFELDLHAQRVVFGVGRIDDVAAEVTALGLRQVMLVASGSAKTAADRVSERLGPRVVARESEIVQHVPEANVASTAQIVHETRADGLVTIGGGSATGLGKAVAVRTGLPLVAVPTTYAGSEATTTYGITGDQKATARDPRALPRVVVYDPVLTIGMPRRLTASSGLNALAHCVEALYGPRANPVASGLAQDAIRTLASALPVAAEVPEDLAARGQALVGAYLGGLSMELAGTALHHALCHVIGGAHRVDHGDLHAVLLPYATAYNASGAPEAVGAVARALGAGEAAAGLRAFAEQLGAPTDLASIGVPSNALDEIALRTVAAVGTRNPRTPDVPSLRRLLDDAYAGRPPGSY